MHVISKIGKVNAIEADVIIGNLRKDKVAVVEEELKDKGKDKKPEKPEEKIPVMAHPPYEESDLSLEDFLKRVTDYNKKNKNTTKAAKLDFKSTDAVTESVKIMKKDWKKLYV